MTLKPAQCALWLRAATPPEQPQLLLPRVQPRLRRAGARLCAADRAAWCGHSGLMALIVAGLVGTRRLGLSRVPTGFLPIEDQGYFVIVVQLPEGAALERTTRALDDVTTRVKAQPGVDQVVAIARARRAQRQRQPVERRHRLRHPQGLGRSAARARTCSASTRGSRRASPTSTTATRSSSRRRPIQGIGNVAGATMKVEIRDGSFDYDKLQRLAQAIADRAGAAVDVPAWRATSFRADAPQINVVIDRVKAETLGVPLGNALGRAQRPMSARAMSASSTSSGACSRSTCRPRRPRA